MVGEIGGNDYNYAAIFGGNVSQLVDNVPVVVEAITNATRALIEEGAVELVVPGNLPVGCSAVYLTLFRSPNKGDYDENGCLNAFNGFAVYHNEQLQLALRNLRHKYPQARIIYCAPRHYECYIEALPSLNTFKIFSELRKDTVALPVLKREGHSSLIIIYVVTIFPTLIRRVLVVSAFHLTWHVVFSFIFFFNTYM
ncbi:hypothetical protein HN51_012426 [Arachis hypogaea]|uniref:GDSL esterase/lipase At5g03980-like n=1 Tax=Arachis hypogaea TaxID=3818 RepID=UPI003B21E1D6|nr:GDSL esterase/lipase [Arachis hypogaea]